MSSAELAFCLLRRVLPAGAARRCAVIYRCVCGTNDREITTRSTAAVTLPIRAIAVK